MPSPKSRADELHDLVLDIAALEQLAHQRNGHIVGAAAGRQAAGEVNGHHTRTGHIVGAAQQLLCQLAAALADGHGAQCTVAGVGVRAKDHFAAAGKLFTHVLVDDSQMRGHKDAAVLFGSRQAEAVVEARAQAAALKQKAEYTSKSSSYPSNFLTQNLQFCHIAILSKSYYTKLNMTI